MIVADGMGGHSAGARASTLAIDTLYSYALNSLPWLFRLEHRSDDHFVAELRAAVEQCEQAIKAESEVISGHDGMGTTLTLAYVLWPRVFVLHVGDSRCYLFRHRKLQQVTRNHTVAQQLVDNGALDEREAAKSRTSSILWNCVGAGGDVQPHIHQAQLVAGDDLLLCSDGLTKHLTHQQIEELLTGNESAERACRKLVDAANQAGGSDNITVVLARFPAESESTPSEVDATASHRSGRRVGAPSLS